MRLVNRLKCKLYSPLSPTQCALNSFSEHFGDGETHLRDHCLEAGVLEPLLKFVAASAASPPSLAEPTSSPAPPPKAPLSLLRRVAAAIYNCFRRSNVQQQQQQTTTTPIETAVTPASLLRRVASALRVLCKRPPPRSVAIVRALLGALAELLRRHSCCCDRSANADADDELTILRCAVSALGELSDVGREHVQLMIDADVRGSHHHHIGAKTQKSAECGAIKQR